MYFEKNCIEHILKTMCCIFLYIIVSKALSTSTASPWLASFYGIWQDSGNTFTAYLPDVDNSVWHYGPARLLSKPVHRSQYGK